MASRKRIAVKGYAGVFYVETTRVNSSQAERVYYIRYRRDGKLVEEKAGYQYRDNMTPAKAAGMRAARIEKRESNNAERRVREKQERIARQERSTVSDIFYAYQESKPDRNWATDRSLYRHYLLSVVGQKAPCELATADMDAIRTSMFKAGKSAQTVKHALALVKRIIRFGVKRGMTPMPDSSRLCIELPKVDNVKTEVLTPAQLAALLRALNEEDDPLLTGLVRLAMCTGMRRGSLLGLQWKDIDFERGFITLEGAHAKKKQTSVIPMNAQARHILENVPHTSSPFVFPGKNDDRPRVDINRFMRRLKVKAGLPEDFRPLHSLRHTFASYLASSGQVSMYELQKLLTHESPQMTQRYAHLHDEALQRASGAIEVMFDKARRADAETASLDNITQR